MEITGNSGHTNVQCTCRNAVKGENDSTLSRQQMGLKGQSTLRPPLRTAKEQTGRLRLVSKLAEFQSRYWARCTRQNFQCH